MGLSLGGEGSAGRSAKSGGYNASRYGSVAAIMSSKSRPSRSSMGYRGMHC
jgi:hypothetical protein